MASNVSLNKTTQRPIPPVGQHLAVCFQIIDMGTQLIQFKPGAEPKATPQIYIGWEFCNPKLRAVFDKEKGEQPMAIFQKYSMYLGPKANLGMMLNSWLSSEIKEMNFEKWNKLAGRTCMIQVVHNPDAKKKDDVTGKAIMYANIGMKGLAIFPRPTEVPLPAGMVNEKLVLFLDHFNWEAFNKVPKFLQEMIKHSAEWSGILKQHGQNPMDAAAEIPAETESFEEREEAIGNAHTTSGMSEEDLPF